MTRSASSRLIATVVVLLLLCVPAFVFETSSYPLRVATLILMFAGMATAWNIIGGEANLVSVGHAAFFGIGAYASTLLLVKYGLSPWLGMVVAALAAGIASLVIGWPSFRLRGHYFALGTLAFAELVRIAALYFAGLTGGALGVSVPPVEDGWLYMQFSGTQELYVIALGMFAVTLGIGFAVHHSALGYRLRALRSSQQAAEVVGVDTTTVKLIANFISCALMGTFGVFYAQMQFFIDPDAVFGFWNISIKVAMMAILGGLGYVWGPFVGALVLVIIDEWSHAVFSNQYTGAGPLLYGVILIVLVLWKPNGLYPFITGLVMRLTGRSR